MKKSIMSLAMILGVILISSGHTDDKTSVKHTGFGLSLGYRL